MCWGRGAGGSGVQDGGDPSEIPGKGILKEDLIRLAASLGLARRILRLRPCRRPPVSCWLLASWLLAGWHLAAGYWLLAGWLAGWGSPDPEDMPRRRDLAASWGLQQATNGLQDPRLQGNKATRTTGTTRLQGSKATRLQGYLL